MIKKERVQKGRGEMGRGKSRIDGGRKGEGSKE